MMSYMHAHRLAKMQGKERRGDFMKFLQTKLRLIANQKSDRIPDRVYEAGFPENSQKSDRTLIKIKLFRKLLFETDYAMLTVRACTSLQYNKYKLELLICCSLLHAYIVIPDAHTCRLTGLRTCRGRKGGEIS